MDIGWIRVLRTFQGAHVSLALTDGSRIDDCRLMSVGRGDLWVVSNGADLFIPVDLVAEVWESCGPRTTFTPGRQRVA